MTEEQIRRLGLLLAAKKLQDLGESGGSHVFLEDLLPSVGGSALEPPSEEECDQVDEVLFKIATALRTSALAEPVVEQKSDRNPQGLWCPVCPQDFEAEAEALAHSTRSGHALQRKVIPLRLRDD
ncbi:hypothetical protein HMI49_34180 [Corallococcus exercitus]|uniref:C2H2-type domain-containing protein n=1 Tax=Corallococcus exercitus TaxID=2316736 RepID=A0A7Y4NV38_9BACT|nr:hypothetical protein [Corallococcus exercitus]NOK38259.1 hypothetical protein [Corallococcus exercitus]